MKNSHSPKMKTEKYFFFFVVLVLCVVKLIKIFLINNFDKNINFVVVNDKKEK